MMVMMRVAETAKGSHGVLLTKETSVAAVTQPHAQHRLLLLVISVLAVPVGLLETLAGAVHHGAVGGVVVAFHGEPRDEVVGPEALRDLNNPNLV